MVTFELEVNHRKIFRHHKHYPQVGDTVNYVRFHFTFKGRLWKDTVKTAVFKSRSFNISRQALIDPDGYCLVPQEILETYGTVLCSVYGVATEGGEVVTRITTDPVDVLFIKDGIHKAPGGPALTPTEYESFIAEVREYITHIKTSDLINDLNFPSDANYVHTDNNYTSEEKSKLGSIEAGAEVNVNADWEADSGDGEIYNKPTIPENVSDLVDDVGILTEETDPVFSASPAADITSEEIDKWNENDVFIAEYGVTTYADIKDAYDEDAIIICTVDDSGNTAIYQLAYFDDANDGFIFTEPTDEGWHWTSIVSGDTWDDGSFQFANTDTATQLRDGLMDALDKQKLDGIASGAEVNVQSDWNVTDITSDAYIANKPTIPEDKVFVATYGTTTFAELLDAYNAEKVIYLKRASTNFTYYYPVSVNPGTSPISNFFLYFTSGNRTISRATLTSGNSWSISSYALQDELVSGTNIKTINGSSILGSGDISVAAGGTPTPTADEVAEFDSNAHMNSTDMTTGADSELEDFIDGLNVSGGGVIKESVTPTSGSNYSGYGNCYYEVMGKLVHFHIGIQGLTANTSTTIYTMPSGLRPSTTMAYKGGGGNSDSTSHLFANADGTIAVNSPQQYAVGDIWYFAS